MSGYLCACCADEIDCDFFDECTEGGGRPPDYCLYCAQAGCNDDKGCLVVDHRLADAVAPERS